MQALIVQGDRSSHGGAVLGGSPFTNSNGVPVARVGDMVSCPRCKGVFPIVEGHAQLRDRGTPIAYHGCKTACGANLISNQTVQGADGQYRGRFRLVDHASGEPIRGRQVRISVSDGASIVDLTDNDGYTSWIERDSAHTLALHLIDPAS